MSTPPNSSPPTPGHRAPRSIEQIARDQGLTLPQDLDALIGAGRDLWDSEAEFEAFVGDLRQRKQEERAREASRQSEHGGT